MNKNTTTEKELDQMEPWEEEYKEYLDSLEDEDEDEEGEEVYEVVEDDYTFQEDVEPCLSLLKTLSSSSI